MADEIRGLYIDLKYRHVYRFIIFKIDPGKNEIVVESTCPTDCTYDDFLARLPANDARFALYDFAYTENDGRRLSKIVFILW